MPDPQSPLSDEDAFHFHLGELAMGMKVLLGQLDGINAKLDSMSAKTEAA